MCLYYSINLNIALKKGEDDLHIPQVCARLGIEIINAHSPQAEGRIERANTTLQNRLPAELRRHNITSHSLMTVTYK